MILARGAAELEQLFPGLRAELRAGGALELDWLTQRFRPVMGWFPRAESGLVSPFCTRALLESTIRARVLARENVAVVDGVEVVELAGDADRVTGVRLRERHRFTVDSARDLLDADLVVDATGRGSHAPDWFAALGRPRPVETVVASHLAYASRLYRMPPRARDWHLLAVRQAPPSRRAAVLYPVEGDRWLVTLNGQGDDLPPHDEAGFAAFAAGIEAVGEALDGAEPLGRIAAYRRTENRWRHYERLRSSPDGFVVAGDALCAFNPVYGQGMTVAAVQARLIGSDLAGAARASGWVDTGHLQRRLARLLRGPWRLATGEDFRYPGTTGRRSAATRLAHAYTDDVLRAATRDPVVAARFLEVVHLLRPSSALAEPRMLPRVARGARAWRASADATS